MVRHGRFPCLWLDAENCDIKNALFELQQRRHVIRDLSLRKAIAQNGACHHTTINGESFFSPGSAETSLRDRWQALNKRATKFEQNRKVAVEPVMPEDL
jgi:hypothetical protein